MLHHCLLFVVLFSPDIFRCLNFVLTLFYPYFSLIVSCFSSAFTSICYFCLLVSFLHNSLVFHISFPVVPASLCSFLSFPALSPRSGPKLHQLHFGTLRLVSLLNILRLVVRLLPNFLFYHRWILMFSYKCFYEGISLTLQLGY